jgi:hypothetical protein
MRSATAGIQPAVAIAGVAAWSFVTAFLGGLVGLVLGNIRLPVLLLAASSPAAGAGANIGVSAVAAATASTAHLRAGRFNRRLFLWMAPPSVAGAVVGGLLSGAVPGDVLLIVIGATLIVFGVEDRTGNRRCGAGGEQAPVDAGRYVSDNARRADAEADGHVRPDRCRGWLADVAQERREPERAQNQTDEATEEADHRSRQARASLDGCPSGSSCARSARCSSPPAPRRSRRARANRRA